MDKTPPLEWDEAWATMKQNPGSVIKRAENGRGFVVFGISAKKQFGGDQRSRHCDLQSKVLDLKQKLSQKNKQIDDLQTKCRKLESAQESLYKLDSAEKALIESHRQKLAEQKQAAFEKEIEDKWGKSERMDNICPVCRGQNSECCKCGGIGFV